MEINNPFKYFFNFPCGYFKGLKDKSVLKGKCCFLVKVLIFFFKMEKKINQFILRFEEEIFFLLKKRLC